MLETFETVAQWESIAATPAANIAANTANNVQGTGAVEFDKTNTSVNQSGIIRKRSVPQSLRPWRGLGLLLTLRHYHADYTGMTAVSVVLVYRYNSSGVPDRFDTYQFTGMTAGANTSTISLDAPTSSSGTPPTDLERASLAGVGIVVTTSATSTTFANFVASSLHLASANASLLRFDGELLLTPPMDTWSRFRDEKTIQNEAQTAAETFLVSAKNGVQFGIRQARKVYDQGQRVHPEEESLALFSEYAAASNGWGVAYSATELVDTTASGAVSAGGVTLPLTSVLDVNLLGPAGVELRVGPNDARQSERVRVVSVSSSTLTLSRPLRYSHESGTPVRSVDYYPSCAKRSQSPALQETGQAVALDVQAVETA